MKNICNNCGQEVPRGAKVCPNCGTLMPNASADEKKFWERDDLQPAATELQKTPPPYKPLKKRRFRMAAILASAAVAIILLFLAIMVIKGAKEHVQVTHQSTKIETRQGPNGTTTTVVTNGNISEAQAQQMMQEMAQMDSMMNAMMGGDPFAELEQMMGDDPSAAAIGHGQPVPARQVRKAAHGVAKMAGMIGNKEYVLVFDYKDPQNVKGSGSTIVGGKQAGKVHVLGILDGSTLTMSIYPQGSKTPTGTINGQFDGSMLQGTYVTNDDKAQETQVIFYEQ